MSMATEAKKRTTTGTKRTNTIRVCGFPSFDCNAIQQLTSNHWFGNIGKILHIDVQNNDHVHVAEISFSSQKEAQAALRWVHQYNASKPKPPRKLQANYTQNTIKTEPSSPLSTNIMLKEVQSLQRQLHTLSSNHTKLKQKNKLLHQIIKRLQTNLHRNEEKQDALITKNKELQDESQNIKSLQLEQKELYHDNQYLRRQQQNLETEATQMSEKIKSIQAENTRLKQITTVLETDRNISTNQKHNLQTNYVVMQQQLNVMLHERQRMLSEREQYMKQERMYKHQYSVAMQWYAYLQREYQRVINGKQVMFSPQTIAPIVSPSPPSLTQEPVAQAMSLMADKCDWLTVCHWIVGIQDGILMKYVNELTTELRVRKTDFNDLYEMDANDLQAIGITDRKDVILLFSEIQKLRLSNEIETAIEGDTDVKMEIEGDLSM